MRGGFLQGGSRRKGSLEEGDTEKTTLDNEQTSSFSILSDVILTPPTTDIPQKTTPETIPHITACDVGGGAFLDYSLTPYALEDTQKTTPETQTPKPPHHNR